MIALHFEGLLSQQRQNPKFRTIPLSDGQKEALVPQVATHQYILQDVPWPLAQRHYCMVVLW